jgi:hypothetical protein
VIKLIYNIRAEQFHKDYYESKSFMPRLGGAFIILNAIVYIGEIVIISLWAMGDNTREGNKIYDLNIIVGIHH